MVSEPSIILVICGADGRPLDVTTINRKGIRKSLEQGSLWSLHTETGRLLPYDGGAGATVIDHGTWCQAILAVGQDSGETSAGDTTPTGAETSNMATDSPPGQANLKPGIGTTLSDLAGVIAERHKTLPEGSYTTHLFASGSDKIRKKLGEEAVELILARTTGETISEAADLIYHLLVFLEDQGITLDQLSSELEGR